MICTGPAGGQTRRLFSGGFFSGVQYEDAMLIRLVDTLASAPERRRAVGLNPPVASAICQQRTVSLPRVQSRSQTGAPLATNRIGMEDVIARLASFGDSAVQNSQIELQNSHGAKWQEIVKFTAITQ